MQNGGDAPAANETAPKPEEVTKQSFRVKVWRHLESNSIAMFPRPVYNRIPNFKGAQEAAAKLAELDVFKNAKSVEVNPDKPQEAVRILCLEQHKTLYVAVPGLQGGYLSRVAAPEGDGDVRKVVSRKGMETHGTAIPIEENVSLDLVVMGCVAVSKEGYRIGKGRGFGDLEFGLLMHMKAIKPNVLVVTTAHDSQVFDTLPAELFGPHDVPVDIIVTPTQVIETQRMSQRPSGILWHLLSSRRLALVPALSQLRDVEMLAGRSCTLKEVDTDIEERQPSAPRTRRYSRRARTRSTKSQSEGEGNTTEGENAKGDQKPRRNTRRRNSHKSKDGKEVEGKEGKEPRPRRSKRPPPVIDFSVKVSNISPSTRVRELKAALAARGVKPQNMIWKGFRGFCYLHFFKTGPQKGEGDAAPALELDSVVASLQGMSLQGAEEDEPRVLAVEPAPPRAAPAPAHAPTHTPTEVEVQ